MTLLSTNFTACAIGCLLPWLRCRYVDISTQQKLDLNQKLDGEIVHYVAELIFRTSSKTNS